MSEKMAAALGRLVVATDEAYSSFRRVEDSLREVNLLARELRFTAERVNFEDVMSGTTSQPVRQTRTSSTSAKPRGEQVIVIDPATGLPKPRGRGRPPKGQEVLGVVPAEGEEGDEPEGEDVPEDEQPES